MNSTLSKASIPDLPGEVVHKIENNSPSLPSVRLLNGLR